jgi:hypothetical protein
LTQFDTLPKKGGNSMKTAQCPHCKEEIRADAMICKHCHERLSWSREELVMTMISERIRINAGASASIALASVSACGALCHAKFASNKVRLNQCLDDCKAAEATAAVAERLHKELIVTFADIVWGGGDIDPLPFEKSVRESFSRLDKP